MKVEIDPDNGSSFAHLGTTQLLAVPYALHAKTAEQIPDNSVTNAKIAPMGATSGQVLKWSGSAWGPSDDLNGGDATWGTSGSNIYYNTGNVGIGTTSPAAVLHANGTGTGGGNVLFSGSSKSNPGDPPASGAGTRMMWYPDKAAFRAGRVLSTEWNKDSIGDFSVAFGINVKARGNSSTAMGISTTASGQASTAMGNNTIASANSSTALGVSTTASGVYSTAMGSVTIASEYSSTAMGHFTTAKEVYSTAMGLYSTASGQASTAMGSFTTASGHASIAMGNYTIAPSYCETVIGRFNTEYIPASATGWSTSDLLFAIGNGTSPSARNNALTVLKNGNVGIGTVSPNKSLTVAGDMEIGTSHGNYRHLRIGGGNSSGFLYGAFAGLGDGFNIGYNYYHNNTTDIIPNSAGGTSRIRMGYGRIEVLTNSSVARPTAGVTIANGATSWSSTSDMRLKTNVKTLTNVLDNLSDLRGVTFNWKEGNQDEQIGFIAQEIEKVYPQVISKNENDHLEVRYTELIPVLLQAIKELKAENDLLKQENNQIKADNSLIKAANHKLQTADRELNSRLEKLEKLFSISEKQNN
jgi:hypothetical protein